MMQNADMRRNQLEMAYEETDADWDDPILDAGEV